MEGNELLQAARAGELERVKALVEQGTGLDKDNALRWAAREGRLKVVQYLVNNRAAVNSTDYLGDTALMRAAAEGQIEIVRFLTDKCKSDVNASNSNGSTALMWAARSGRVEVVRYLAGQVGIELDTKDQYGYTALMKACKRGDVEILKNLAAAGADVNESDELGHTALMVASGSDHLQVVRYLVETCGAVVNSRNNRGETAVRVASDCGCLEIERYLTPFLLHSPPSHASATTSATESGDHERSLSVSIAPSEIEPIDFSTNSSMGRDHHHVKWLGGDASVKLLCSDSGRSSVEEVVSLRQGLRHPNVMNLYGICDPIPRVQLFVCEYSSHGTLADLIRSTLVERQTVWKHLHEAAVGLAYLHKRGIVHGDLRCGNILIGSDGIAKLINFDMQMKPSADSTGAVGFVRWQSPEVLRGEKMSFQSDVYSLGLSILEAVTREMPWQDCESDVDVTDLKKTIDKGQEPRCSLGDVKSLVWSMCYQDRDKRASIASVVRELDRLAVGSGSGLAFDEFDDGAMSEMWVAVSEAIRLCDNDFCFEVFNEIKTIQGRLHDSRHQASVLRGFHALIRDFRSMIKLPSAGSLVLKLSSGSVVPCSIVGIRQQLRSLWSVLGETADQAREREARWERYGWLGVEIFLSEESTTYLVLGDAKSHEERVDLLASLRTEINHSFKYTPGELDLLNKAVEDISSQGENETLSKLAPQWFIPWHEIVIDEWNCLGEGGFGSVHRANWLESNVAVKLVSLRGFRDPSSSLQFWASSLTPMTAILQPEVLAMFCREVDLWLGLNHPHVVRLFGACHIGSPFLVCEYAPSGTLVDYLREHPDEVWTKLFEAALGVQYLHARGVVHGDLKGNNVVIGGDLKAKVTDFGLSFLSSDATHVGINGAWQWMAPECLSFDDDTQRPTFASDVYSLGMCIVEALRVVEAVKTGKDPHQILPWRIHDRVAVKYHATRGELPSRPYRCEDAQWGLVQQMCVLDPTKRLRIAEVVDELSKLERRQHNGATDFSLAVSLDFGSIPQVAATAQRLLARLQRESQREEWVSVLLLYVSLWNRLEQMHGQISVKDGAHFGVELCSIVGEIHAFTAKLQDSNTSALSLAELALQCHVFERRLNEFQDGDTDLVWAARNGQTEVVRALIEDGTDVNAQADGGDTALMVAVEFDQIEVVKYLIENGASLTATNGVGNSVLMTAAEKGHVILCQYLAQQPGADVNATNKFGYTALTRAAANGDLQVVQNLAGQRGADVNAGSKNGLAALTMATLGGATDVVRYLAEDCGADVDCKAKNGDTLSMVAASAGHFDLVKYFVDYCGADVNVMNESGDTTLIRAAEGGHTNIVRLCLADYGADVNVRNEGGNTALMKAAEKGRVDVVRCLLEQGGTDVDAKNQRGQTAFRLAHAYQEVRRMLTPFLPPRPQQRTGGVRASTRASISPTEIELVRFCETGNIGGEYRAKWLDADAVVKLFVPDASVTSFDEEVHLRCGNILIGSDGLAKLSNFGLSGSMMRSYRGSSGVFGSMRWLASEILEGIAIDSLGMCILEAGLRERTSGGKT